MSIHRFARLQVEPSSPRPPCSDTQDGDGWACSKEGTNHTVLLDGRKVLVCGGCTADPTPQEVAQLLVTGLLACFACFACLLFPPSYYYIEYADKEREREREESPINQERGAA